jgi:prepilin-type N-terminal cleavage/methylation domain-containing protein
VPRPRRQVGFTLIEALTVVAIAAIVAALAYGTYANTRPRAELASVATEVHGLLSGARHEALARGRSVSVFVFADQPFGQGRGRLLVVPDGAAPLPACAALAGAAGAIGEVSLPRHVRIAPQPPTRLLSVPFPWSQVPAPGPNGCSFCGAGGGTGIEGVIRFDPRGRATFLSACGGPLAPTSASGGSLALTSLQAGASPALFGPGPLPVTAADTIGTRLVVVQPTGVIRTFSQE